MTYDGGRFSDTFPGAYNNLFSIKDADGKTVKLIVDSPGYVMEFGVDPNAVP